MTNELNMLKEFHEKFQLTINEKPNDDISNIDFELRNNLILEEAREFSEAYTLELKLDALCDLLYVTFGAAITYGFTNILPKAFAEVHRSNMSKLWTMEERDSKDEDDTLDFFPVGDIKNERCWLAKRKSDGKVIKSPSYSPADFKQFLTP